MKGAHVQIGTHSYQVDLARVMWRPTATLTQQQDQGARKGEQSLDGGGIWKRTQSDFILGQGQQFFDQEEESDPRRYYWGYQLDALTDRRAVRLLPQPTAAVGPYASAPYTYTERVIVADTGFYLMTYTAVYKVASGLGSATAVTGFAGNPQDIAYFDGKIFIATSTAVYSGATSGTSVTSFSANPVQILTATYGRLVCANNRELFELSSTGTKISIYTHGDSTWTWKAICAGSSGVYVAGSNGVQSEIVLTTLLDVTGAFAPPFPVAQLPSNETITRMAFFGGILIVASTQGVRVMQASQAGYLQYGPLMALGWARGIAFTGRMAWIAVDDPLPEGWSGGCVMQLDLSRFTAPLTPAYGLAYVGSSFVKDVAVRNGVIAFAGNTSGNTTLYRCNGTTYDAGVLDTGTITYGTPEPKQVLSAEVVFDALPSGGSVRLGVWDGSSEVAWDQTSALGATSLRVDVPSLLTEGFSLRVTLSGAAGVVLRRWTVRSVAAPSYVPQEVLLPLMLNREQVSDDGGRVVTKPRDEWEYLHQLSRTREKVVVTFGDEEFTAWVDQVGVNEGGWLRWDQNTDGWPDGTVLVRLLSVGDDSDA
jgi:hypothetical protein